MMKHPCTTHDSRCPCARETTTTAPRTSTARQTTIDDFLNLE